MKKDIRIFSVIYVMEKGRWNIHHCVIDTFGSGLSGNFSRNGEACLKGGLKLCGM